MEVMKEVGESVEQNNRGYLLGVSFVAFTNFDYDTIIELSSAWADSLRCVK